MNANMTRSSLGPRTWLFATTLGLSAFLLFAVQPMFARLALPLLGGAPAVWNTAMAFFQMALLAGYVWAHGVAARMPLAVQRVAQPMALAIGLISLPLALPAGVTPPGDASPIVWLLGLLAISVGLPFIVLAANAPLLQSWFGRFAEGDARDPYFLYAASNVGSVGALLAYPTVIEPTLDLAEQSTAWAGAYLVLIGLVGLCALTTRGGAALATPSNARPSADALSVGQWLRWILLAAVPSALLLGVTGHITTDIAAVPLLWILPLTLYLLTFVIAFARNPLIPHAWTERIAPFAVVALVIALWLPGAKLVALAIHVGGFFILALLCHGTLVRARPASFYLTSFYICLAAGGALGGTIIAVAAPLIFDDIHEYPIAIAAACLAAAWRPTARMPRWPDLWWPVCATFAFVGLRRIVEPSGSDAQALVGIAIVIGGALLVFASRTRPWRYALTVAVCTLVSPVATTLDPLFQARSFFGVFRVSDDHDQRIRRFWHGTTMHGAQSLEPSRRHEPLAYYDAAGPIGQLHRAYATRLANAEIGTIGLGIGSLACYAKPGQHWTFFEIDPLVVRIARNRALFTLLTDCAPQARVVIGDGRLTLRQSPPGIFDLLIVDAFSSDSVPMHLLTREAFAQFASRLARGGMIVMNISNRYLLLEPVIAATAAAESLVGRAQIFRKSSTDTNEYPSLSHWIVLARDEATLAALDGNAWRPMVADGRTRPWTDAFANILSALR